MMKENKDFFSVESKIYKTSQGDVSLPILYYDYSYVLFPFMVNYKLAKKKLAGSGFEPCRFFNGKAMATLIFFEYRESAIGPYNEVGLAMMAYPAISKKPFFYLPQLFYDADSLTIGAYVLNLPVSKEIANAAGKELWNFPKFLTEISFSLIKNRFEGSIIDPDTGRPMLSISARIGALGIYRKKNADFVSYTVLNGLPLRTVVNVKAKSKVNNNFRARLRVFDSKHPMAQNLIDLGLQDEKPGYILSTDKAQSILHAGVPILSSVSTNKKM